MDCFKGTGYNTSASDNQMVRIPGYNFRTEVKDFMFNLTVVKDGRPPNSITQLVSFEYNFGIEWVVSKGRREEDGGREVTILVGVRKDWI